MGQRCGKCIRPILIAALFLAGLLCVTTSAEAQSQGGDTTVVPSSAARVTISSLPVMAAVPRGIVSCAALNERSDAAGIQRLGTASAR